MEGRLRSFRPAERLHSPACFRRVFRKGLRLDGPLFVLIAAANAGREDRLGLVAGRKLGGAVARNRAKRLLRESFRRHKRTGGARLDLVLVPKKEIARSTADEVAFEYRKRLERLSQQQLRRGPRPAPDD